MSSLKLIKENREKVMGVAVVDRLIVVVVDMLLLLLLLLFSKGPSTFGGLPGNGHEC